MKITVSNRTNIKGNYLELGQVLTGAHPGSVLKDSCKLETDYEGCKTGLCTNNTTVNFGLLLSLLDNKGLYNDKEPLVRKSYLLLLSSSFSFTKIDRRTNMVVVTSPKASHTLKLAL